MASSDTVQAFKDFDFDGSDAWQDYLRRVEMPTSSAEAMLKLKAKWYNRNIDDTLNVSDVVGNSIPQQTSSAAPQAQQPSAAASSQQEQPSTNTSSRSTFSTASFRQASRQQLLLFCLHSAIILCAVVYVIPIFPRLSLRSYKLILQINILASLVKIHAAHGLPSFHPLSGLKNWAARAIPTTDFQYMMLSIVFLSHPSMALLLVPIITLAVYHVFAYGHQHYAHTQLWRSYGVRAFQWLGAKQRTALTVNALAEVLVGFMLIFQLVTPARNFLLIYLYWNMLKMRFWATDAAAYHRQVWSILDTKTAALRARVPVLQTAISFVQKWFNSVGR